MNIQTMLFATVVIGSVVFIIIMLVWDAKQHRQSMKFNRQVKEQVEAQLNIARPHFLAKGEKIGYEKGYEAGKLDARDELRTQFVLFLEEQVKILKNQLPPPTL